MKHKISNLLITVAFFLLSVISGNSQSLYVGANYHPFDDSHSILFDKDYTGNFTIAPYEPEFIELK